MIGRMMDLLNLATWAPEESDEGSLLITNEGRENAPPLTSFSPAGVNF